jgi:hypothetical protein
MMTNWIIFKMLDIYCLVGRLIMTKPNKTKSERFTVGINNFLKGKKISLLDNYSNSAWMLMLLLQWVLLNGIMDNVINRLMGSNSDWHVPNFSCIPHACSSSFDYWNQLVIVISFFLSQSDPFRRLNCTSLHITIRLRKFRQTYIHIHITCNTF